MKKIIALSDTHGNHSDLVRLIPLFNEADIILFAGDGINDFNGLPSDITKKLKMVKGNCDDAPALKELFFKVEDRNLLLTHGDLYGVKRSLTPISLRAKEIGADLVIFGHTHLPMEEESDGILFANPGTLSRFGTQKTFLYLVIDGAKAVATVNRNFFGGF